MKINFNDWFNKMKIKFNRKTIKITYNNTNAINEGAQDETNNVVL